MDSNQGQIRVGIGVMVFKNGKVLMGKRKSPNGLGQFAWPGGHLEYGESFEQCARREVKEETGLEIKDIRFLRLANFMTDIARQYADIGMMADWASGEPKVLEPEKCESWNWYDPENLPEPLFQTIPSYIEALKTKKTFFDL